MKATIKVTQDHIDNGVPGKCDKCPIALACLEAGFTDPYIFGDDNDVTGPDGLRYTFRSKEAQDFVNAFDDQIADKPEGLPAPGPIVLEVELEQVQAQEMY